MIAVIVDIFLDDFHDLNGGRVDDSPAASLGFIVDTVTDVTDSVPIRFALVVKLASSFDPEDSVFEFRREVENTFLVLITNTGNETLESVFHDPFSFVAFLWLRWGWMVAAVFFGFFEDLDHSVESILGMVPVTSHGLVLSLIHI